MRIETSSFQAKFIDYHIFDFGYVYFFENVFVTEFNEGVLIEYDQIIKVLDQLNKYYCPDSNVVYISNRVNSYSIYPTHLLKFSNKFKNIKAVAVVNYNSTSRKLFEIEKMFLKRSFEGFENLNAAYNWAIDILKKKHSS